MLPSPIYCTNCGAPNQAQAKFCFGYGQSLQGVMPASTNSPTGLLVANYLLKQRYPIHSQAGKGGFAAVYKTEDTLNHIRASLTSSYFPCYHALNIT